MTVDFKKHEELDKEYGLNNLINELAKLENNLRTWEKLSEWFEKFDELKVIIENNINEDQKATAQENEEKIREFVTSQFKYQNLLEIVFAIGTYCLFKEKYTYIKYLWEYKQPPDSDAHWIGQDITPQSIESVIQFYFRKELLGRKFDFWEGHRGSKRYYNQYFLLLLARVLQSVHPDTEGKYQSIENYKLSDLNIHKLSDLEHSIDGFIKIAVDLKKEEIILAEIGLDTKKLEELFDFKLIPFLNKLKEEVEKQILEKHKIGKISQKKIEDFKKGVLKSFFEGVNIRIILKYLDAYEDKTGNKITGKEKRFGINTVDDKASFFDEWHVHFLGWGENYGCGLAFDEDSFLFDYITMSCKNISKINFEDTLSKFKKPEDIIIFATNFDLWQFFEDSKNFKPEWHSDTKKLNVKGFGGWYNFKSQLIPVFNIYTQKIEKQILILNKTRLGKLVQLSPLNDGEDEKSVEDIFYIKIQSFSENKEQMENFIKEPTDWLKKIGEEQKQREYLEECVLIQIFERFEYNKPEDFEGYKLIFKNDVLG